jgi:ferritin
MDFNQELFKGKSFSNLLEDIYKNSIRKEKEIRSLIDQLKPMIQEPGDAMMLVPLLKEYMELGIKNDDALIKMAGIVQRAMNNIGNDGDGSVLSDRDKELLFQEINNVTAPIEPKQLEANNN